MGDAIARQAATVGTDAAHVAAALVAGLGDGPTRLVMVFADARIDAAQLAIAMQAAFVDVPVIGCTTRGVVSPIALAGDQPGAVAIALGGGMRVGIGIATELSKLAIARGRDAVHRAADALGTTPDALDSTRHVLLTLIAGTGAQEEAFCIGAAAPAPQLKVVGGVVAPEHDAQPAIVWVRGSVYRDAAVVVLLDIPLPFHAVTSSHLIPTEIRTVVTAATGRTIEALDGRPAAGRLRELLAKIDLELGSRPAGLAFARYIDGVPYVRAVSQLVDDRVELAGAVEAGHVLRVMRPGDLIGTTRRDLMVAADRVGGEIHAFIAFSCIERHWEAHARGLDAQLAAAYGECAAVGFQSFGEHAGLLLVNHTLTGLAIGAHR